MKTQTSRYFYFMLLAFIFPAFSCSSQNVKSKITEEEFQKFDGNKSGWLSGNELVSCKCDKYDSDGDKEVTKEEFFKGRGSKILPKPTIAAETNQSKTKPEMTPNNGTGSSNIKGAWAYTTILYADRTMYELRNRMSSLNLNEDGKYDQITWVGSATQGFSGKHILSGNRLMLTPGGGKKEVFTTSISENGQLLTLKAGDGSGWKLERPKK